MCSQNFSYHAHRCIPRTCVFTSPTDIPYPPHPDFYAYTIPSKACTPNLIYIVAPRLPWTQGNTLLCITGNTLLWTPSTPNIIYIFVTPTPVFIKAYTYAMHSNEVNFTPMHSKQRLSHAHTFVAKAWRVITQFEKNPQFNSKITLKFKINWSHSQIGSTGS